MCKEVFQNILCYCLSFWRYEPCRRKRISKHLMLLFIMYRRPFPATAVCISKHLMLLFIYLAISGIVEFLKFQNILCYCLSISTAECRTNRIISKHLMLLFIVMQHRKRDQYISKHLMLLFIFIFFPAATLPSSISKHLMLLFIRRRTLNRFTTDISKHLMLLFIPYPAFIILTEL